MLETISRHSFVLGNHPARVMTGILIGNQPIALPRVREEIRITTKAVHGSLT